MFSRQLQEYAQRQYHRRLPFLGAAGEQIEQELMQCTPEEQILMQFFYGTMPLGDAAAYEFKVFLGFVRHSLMLYRDMEWCRGLSEEIFLHHILYYRINSEKIEDCRRFFYEQLIERIRGKSVQEAVLEINYWCAENGSYEASDLRTISPLTLYRSGKGRCGEESVFAVTAFRSVGIPARQVYTPRWAHCDDNHAWVEVYIEGKWHFLGACEPEEVLDRGWFTGAASRAPLIHTRNFSDYGSGLGEICLGKRELLTFYNITPAYARTKELQIQVREADGGPAIQAQIAVEVLNSGEYSSIAELYTDTEGRAAIRLGLGTVHLWVRKERAICEASVNIRDTSDVAIVLMEEAAWRAGADRRVWTDIDAEAPTEGPLRSMVLTGEQRERNRRKRKEAEILRKRRIEGYYREEAAEGYPQEKEMLREAAGNFEEIFHFLKADENPDRKILLHSLAQKDYKDVSADILEHHLQGAFQYGAEWKAKDRLDIYRDAILCPRIYLEELTAYRDTIRNYFSAEELDRFVSNPESIWEYIKHTITYDEREDYSTLYSAPADILKLGFGNLMSQKILFVAICRTLGIPARIHPVSKEAEMYRNGSFVPISDEKNLLLCVEPGRLCLKRREGEIWNYYQSWTIAQLQEGHFVTLSYEGLRIAEKDMELELKPGIYRLLTSNRLPNGNQLASEYLFRLRSGETIEVELRQRSGRPEELLVANPLEDFTLERDGTAVSAALQAGKSKNIFAFLEVGQEPTEHVLNEMLEQQVILRKLDVPFYILLRNTAALENTTLQKVLTAIPDIRIAYVSFEEVVEPLARRMYVDPDKLPFLLVTAPEWIGIYACSGYHVGSVELIRKLLKTHPGRCDP